LLAGLHLIPSELSLKESPVMSDALHQKTPQIIAALALLLAARVACATDPAAVSPVTISPSHSAPDITATTQKLVQFCYQVDGLDAAQIKARLETCKPAFDALKQTTDTQTSFATLAKDAAERDHAAADAQRVQQWGQHWSKALWIGDLIAIGFVIVVIVAAFKTPNPASFLTEDGNPGKPSFGRLLGLMGGLAALTYVGLITNVCLSYLLATGKLPDQIGTVYASAVSTFLTALIPYLIGKLKS
jgi:hypothetical protein